MGQSLTLVVVQTSVAGAWGDGRTNNLFEYIVYVLV